MTDSLTSLGLIETQKGLKVKKFSKQELNLDYLNRINKINSELNAFLSINHESSGIPAGIKDLISVEGLKMTCGSKILENYSPVYNATVIENLFGKGVSAIGKTNLDEFAMGSSGENSAYGPTKNPWDKTKVTGGSSSGSAAAVVADLCTFALGTDTGGSIRQPAALCGVVGLKPSYGRVSRYGAQAMASSLDQIGPITKSVADARTVLSWISGGDNFDSNCIKEKFEEKIVIKSFKNIKIGVPKEYFAKGLDEKVGSNIKKAIKSMEDKGASVVDVELPHTGYAIATYYIIMASEASSNLGRYDGIRFGGKRDLFGDEPKRRIILGTFALSTGYFEDYFIKAAKVRRLITEDFEKAFEKCDIIAGPVSPTVAWNIGEKVEDPLSMYLSDIYTVPASLAGIPALSVPCGFVDGLPVGLQLIGRYMDEATILDIGELFESANTMEKKKPNI